MLTHTHVIIKVLCCSPVTFVKRFRHVCTHGLALSGRNQLQTSTKTLSPAPYQIGLHGVLDVKPEENTTSQWIHAALNIVWMA